MKRAFIFLNQVLIFILFLINTLFGQNNSSDIVIGKSLKFQSKILDQERSIRIGLPAGYESGKKMYPVIFVLDGNSNFGFTNEMVRYLCLYNLVPEMIIVGIQSINRDSDFLPSLTQTSGKSTGHVNNSEERRSGNADRFIKFLQDELIPYLDKNYRTLPYRTIIGHSLAGLFVIHSLLENPDLFSGYISISPSLWWNNKEYLEKPAAFFKTKNQLNKNLFITMANESDDNPGFIKKLKYTFEKNLPKELISEVKIYPDKNHFTTPVEAIMDGLLKIYSTWMPPMEMVMKGNLEDIKKHYNKISNQLGFSFLPPEGSINQAGYMRMRRNELDEAIEFFKYNTELYPDSYNTFDSLAEAYIKAGNKELAIENYEKSLKLNPENKNAVEQLKIINSR